MKAYIDCCMNGRESWQARQAATRELLSLEAGLELRGFESLNFSTRNLPFDPVTSLNSIADFVSVSDFVVAFSGHAMLGFSESAREAMRRHRKPGICFVFVDDVRRVLPEQNGQWPQRTFLAISDAHDAATRISVPKIRMTQRMLADH